MFKMSFKEFLLWMLVACYGLLLWYSSRVNPGLQLNEGLQIQLSKQSLLEIFSVQITTLQPPLYSVLLHFWMNLFGNDIETVRAFSIGCTLASVTLLYKLFTQQLSGLNSLLGAMVFGTFPLVIIVGFTAQSYALLLLLIISGMLAGFTLWNSPFTKINLGILTLITTTLLYTHNLGLILVMCASLFILLAKPQLNQIKLYFGSLGLSLLLYLPWILAQWNQVNNVLAESTQRFDVFSSWKELLMVIAPLGQSTLSLYGLVYSGLLIVFMQRVWLKGSLSRGKTVAVIASLLLIIMFGLSFIEPVFYHYHLIGVLPLFGLAVAYSLPKFPAHSVIASFVMVVVQLSLLTKTQEYYAATDFYNIEQGLYNTDKESVIVLDSALYLFHLQTKGYTRAYLFDPARKTLSLEGKALLQEENYVSPAVLTTNKIQVITKNKSDFGTFFEDNGYQIIDSRNPPRTGVYLLQKQ